VEEVEDVEVAADEDPQAAKATAAAPTADRARIRRIRVARTVRMGSGVRPR
jgi:hypothetical protein